MPTITPSIPNDLSELLQATVTDFPTILHGDLVGLYLWGSLTYEAFDETCSDVDFIVVTKCDLNDHEFSTHDQWFQNQETHNRWVKRIDMRFVIEGEFLNEASRCCGFYHYTGKLVRHGSDGNPIIWINIGQSGITLWGKEAKLIVPKVSDSCLNEALLLELDYLKEDLTANAGDRSANVFIHNAYAVLTACRILFTAHHGTLASKKQAHDWVMKTVASPWQAIIHTASDNRPKYGGSTTPQLEQDAVRFVQFVTDEIHRLLDRSGQT